jgi:hypothetical protein
MSTKKIVESFRKNRVFDRVKWMEKAVDGGKTRRENVLVVQF